MKKLTAARICRALKAGSNAKLELNRHQKADQRVKMKQEHVTDDLRASGKANFEDAMKKLAP